MFGKDEKAVKRIWKENINDGNREISTRAYKSEGSKRDRDEEDKSTKPSRQL